MLKRILGMIPHLCIIISLMLLTFFVTDRFNTAMAFINHPMTKQLLLTQVILCLLCLVMLLFRSQVRRSVPLVLLCAVCAVLALTLGAVLLIDLVIPRLILFTVDLTKVVIALTAVAGTVISLVLIRFQRRSAARRLIKEAPADDVLDLPSDSPTDL